MTWMACNPISFILEHVAPLQFTYIKKIVFNLETLVVNEIFFFQISFKIKI